MVGRWLWFFYIIMYKKEVNKCIWGVIIGMGNGKMYDDNDRRIGLLFNVLYENYFLR